MLEARENGAVDSQTEVFQRLATLHRRAETEEAGLQEYRLIGAAPITATRQSGTGRCHRNLWRHIRYQGKGADWLGNAVHVARQAGNRAEIKALPGRVVVNQQKKLFGISALRHLPGI